MKKTKFFTFLMSVLSVVLIAQVALGPVSVRFYAHAAGQENVEPQFSDTNRPTSVDDFYLTKQFRRSFKPNGEMTETPLAQIQTSLEKVDVINWAKEVKVIYNSDAKELSWVYSGFDKKTKELRPLEAHVIKGVDLVAGSNIEFADPNFIYLSSKEGILAIATPQANEGFFVAPVPVMKALPALPLEITSKNGSAYGLQVSKVERLSRGDTKPRVFDNLSPQEKIYDGDLSLTFGRTDGEMIDRGFRHAPVQAFSYHVSYQEVLRSIRIQQLALMKVMQFANPDFERLPEYQKIFSDAAQDQELLQKTQDSVLNSMSNDAFTHALENLRQRMGYERLGGLLGSLDSLSDLRKTPRDVFLADSSESQMWSKAYEATESFKKSKLGSSTRDLISKQTTFKELVLADFEGSGEVLEKAAKMEKKAEVRMRDRIGSAFKKLMTPAKIAFLGAVILDSTLLEGQGRDLTIAFVTQALHLASQVPVVKIFAEPAQGSLVYLTQNVWNIGKFVASTGVILSFQPLSYFAGKLAALRSGKSWDKVTAFFNFGIRTYAKINYPILKLLLWDPLRQKNLYSALDNGVNPLQNKYAWNNPLSSEKGIQERSRKLDQSIVDDAVLKSRAMVLAAAYVSEKSAATKSPVDIASLLLAGKGEQAQKVIQTYQTAEGEKKWAEMTMMAYKALVDLGDDPQSRLEEQSIQKYVDLYGKLAKEFSKIENEKSGLGSTAKKYLVEKLQTTRKVMSRSVLSYLLFQKQGYDLYRKYRNVEVDRQTAEIADEAYRDDYIGSTYIYAVAAAEKFGDVVTLGKFAPEILANQLSQVFIYGIQGAVDPLSMMEGQSGFVNAYSPLSNELYGNRRNREQTVWEGLKSITSKTLDPQARGGFENHGQYMKNTLVGFQVRFLADYATRVLGVLATKSAAGAPYSVLGVMAESAQLSSYFLLSKASFHAGAVGYATVWPYIQLFQKHMKDSAAENLKDIQYADYQLESGVRLKDREMIEAGIEMFQEMYKKDGHQLPEVFRKAPKSFSEVEVKEFQGYTLDHVALPTQNSSKIAKTLNIGVGSVMSTVLFDQLSTTAYDPNSNAAELLEGAVRDFGLTMAGLGVASTVTTKAAEGIQKLSGKNPNQKCEAGLLKKSS